MQNATLVATLVPNAAEMLTLANLFTARTGIAAGGDTIWYAPYLNEGEVLWAVPGVGWLLTTQRRECLVLLHCREDRTVSKGNHLNRTEVGFGRPTLTQHWECLRACLVAK